MAQRGQAFEEIVNSIRAGQYQPVVTVEVADRLVQQSIVVEFLYFNGGTGDYLRAEFFEFPHKLVSLCRCTSNHDRAASERLIIHLRQAARELHLPTRVQPVPVTRASIVVPRNWTGQ